MSDCTSRSIVTGPKCCHCIMPWVEVEVRHQLDLKQKEFAMRINHLDPSKNMYIMGPGLLKLEDPFEDWEFWYGSTLPGIEQGLFHFTVICIYFFTCFFSSSLFIYLFIYLFLSYSSFSFLQFFLIMFWRFYSSFFGLYLSFPFPSFLSTHPHVLCILATQLPRILR